MMMDLIVGKNLPLRIVESQGFLNFMKTVDPRYKPSYRQTMKKKITHKTNNLKHEITEKLAKCEAVNTTVDLWTDRTMCSFIGVTAHNMEDDESIHNNFPEADEDTAELAEDEVESSTDLDDNILWEPLDYVDRHEFDFMFLNTVWVSHLLYPRFSI
ncbi:hypothetical protein Y1Q_0013731 [Alligator mississippiensis]|uniref:Uncharacterized protein n=1 Tax=Alligator mississippiensis TaxID=8496 RepID=A0A151NX52_ALLMI|nr:hypothetical protein Y1Q_0013731 [Alligator mississippiensis]